MKLKTLFRRYNYPGNTISGTIGSNVITGSGTKFTEIPLHTSIETDGGFIGKVASIESDTHLTLDRALTANITGVAFWMDWSMWKVSNSQISRKIESENAGEAGAIVFDNASLEFYYGDTLEVAGVVYNNPIKIAFQGDIDSKKRYLLRLQALKDYASSNTGITIFEGMVDFSSVSFPDYVDESGEEMYTIEFDVMDKLSALSMLESKLARTYTEGMSPAPAANAVEYSFLQGTGISYLSIRPKASDGSYNAVSTNEALWPINRGMIWEHPDLKTRHIILSAKIIALGAGENKLECVIYPAVSNTATVTVYSPNVLMKKWGKEFYGQDIGIYETSTVYYGTQPTLTLTAFDALVIIKALILQRWGDTALINKTGVNLFPIPLTYFGDTIDEYPLGKEALDALSFLGNTMNCYIFYNRTGGLILLNKSSLDTTPKDQDKAVPCDGLRNMTKKYFWDKLVDAVKVTVLSWIKNSDGVFLEGTGYAYKKAGIKPRNEIDRQVFIDKASAASYGITINPDGTLSDPTVPDNNQQSILNHYSIQKAQEYLDFYGKRHIPYHGELSGITEEMLSWDLIDIFDFIQQDSFAGDANNGRYFLPNITIDIEEDTIEFDLVSISRKSYDESSILIGQMDDSYTSGGGGSYSSSSPAPSGYSGVNPYLWNGAADGLNAAMGRRSLGLDNIANIGSGQVSTAEFNYLMGLTGNIQTQLNALGHGNRAYLDTINQALGTANTPTFAGATLTNNLTFTNNDRQIRKGNAGFYVGWNNGTENYYDVDGAGFHQFRNGAGGKDLLKIHDGGIRVFGLIEHADQYNYGNSYLLNKAGSGWLAFASRNTDGADAVYNLYNVGNANLSGNLTIGGNFNVPGDFSIVNAQSRRIFQSGWTEAFGDYTAVNSGYDWNSDFEPVSIVASRDLGVAFYRASVVGTPYGTQLARIDKSGNGIFSGNLTVNGSGNNYFAGKVGVGVASPYYKLDVSGDLHVEHGSQAMIFNNTYGATIWLDGVNGDFAGGDYSRITSDITGSLTLSSGSGGTVGSLFLQTNNTNRLEVNKDGNAKFWGDIYSDNYTGVDPYPGYYIGRYGSIFGKITANEMHVKSFIADLEMALAGSQIIAKSVAKLYQDFEVGQRLVVEEFEGFIGWVFETGDYVRLRVQTRDTGLTSADLWGTVSNPTRDDTTKTQSYTFNILSGSGVKIKKGSLAIDYGKSGNGIFEIVAVGPLGKTPFAQIATWNTAPYTDLKIISRFGDLTGVPDNIFGVLSGFGVYTQRMYLSSMGGDQNAITMIADNNTALLRLQTGGNTIFDFDTATATAKISGWKMTKDAIYNIDSNSGAQVEINSYPYFMVGYWQDKFTDGKYTVTGVIPEELPYAGEYGIMSCDLGLNKQYFALTDKTKFISKWYFDDEKLYNNIDANNGVRFEASAVLRGLAIKSVGSDVVKVGMFNNVAETYGTTTIANPAWTAGNISPFSDYWDVTTGTDPYLSETGGVTLLDNTNVEPHPYGGGYRYGYTIARTITNVNIPGKTVSCSFRVRYEEQVNGGDLMPVFAFIRYKLSADGASYVTPRVYDITPSIVDHISGTQTWKACSIMANVPAGATSVQIVIRMNKNYSDTYIVPPALYIDSFSISYYNRSIVELNENGFKMFRSPINKIELNNLQSSVSAPEISSETIRIGNFTLAVGSQLNGDTVQEYLRIYYKGTSIGKFNPIDGSYGAFSGV